MTTLNNLEKLIQMATIEQMYNMLQKLLPNEAKTGFSIDPIFSKCSDDFTNSNELIKLNSDEISKLKLLVGSLTYENDAKLHEIVNLKSKFEQLENKTNGIISLLTERISILESSLLDIKQNSENNSKFLCQQIRGQQTLARFGFTGTTTNEETSTHEENITLKIEEKIGDKEEEEEEQIDEEEEEEQIVEEEEEEEEQIDEEEEDQQEEEEQIVEEEDQQEEEKIEEEDQQEEEEQKIVEDENSSEDEVGTEEEEEQKDEEEEEVFEIEIDDVTYYATHEENGILYEMTKDGDIGNKVGIIKDGEPIFN
jgi:hypothetical protein